MKEYKALFLDWDDTIGDFQGAAKEAMQQLFAEHGLAAHFGDFRQYYELYHAHNVWLWEQYGQGLIRKDYLSFDRFFFPLMHAPKPMAVDEAVTLARRLSGEYLERNTQLARLRPGAEEAVRQLATRYRLYVVSNGFVEVQYRKIDSAGLRDCFQGIVLSEEVGVQKPHPQIFERALELAGVRADEALMIGDSWSSDIQGAIGSGIDQLWVQTTHVADTNLPSTYKVADLTDVLGLLM